MIPKDNDTFCVLPWIHLYVGTDGNILPCCQADQALPFGNIEANTVLEIRNNKQFRELRNSMINNKQHSACKRCYLLESQGAESERIIQNRVWNSIEDFDFNADVVEKNPIYFDIRLSNLCNLKCRMCSSYFSSSIQQEEEQIWGIKQASTLTKSRKAESIEQILDLLPNVEKLYFAGGEPLMSPEHYRILERVIELNKTDISLNYTTNFTKLQHGKWNVLELWNKFDNVNLLASLDADGDIAEYVRHGTIWKEILKNYQQIKTIKNVKFSIMSTVGFMNVENLIEMQTSWHNNGFDLNNWFIHALISPERLSLGVLNKSHKQRISDAIEQHIELCPEELAQQWSVIQRYMHNTDHTQHLPELKRLTYITDRHRKENFAEVLPQFVDLIK